MRDWLHRVSFCSFGWLAVALGAQEEVERKATPCPHQVIARVPDSVVASNVVRCGTGIEWNFGTFRYSTPPGTCALLLTYTPEHATTQASASSYTYTQPLLPVTTYIGRYRCVTSRFLWFLPIGSSCEEIFFGAADRVPSYVQHRCED